MDTVLLAEQYRARGAEGDSLVKVVGVDLSGNPYKNMCYFLSSCVDYRLETWTTCVIYCQHSNWLRRKA